jgi:hypothetical protein
MLDQGLLQEWGFDGAGSLGEDVQGGTGELDLEGRDEHDRRSVDDYGFVWNSRNPPHILRRPLVRGNPVALCVAHPSVKQ